MLNVFTIRKKQRDTRSLLEVIDMSTTLIGGDVFMGVGICLNSSYCIH